MKNSERECKSFLLVSTIISHKNSLLTLSMLVYFISKDPFFVPLFSWYFVIATLQKPHNISLYMAKEFILIYIIKFRNCSEQKQMVFLNGISWWQHGNYRESYNKRQKKNGLYTEITKTVIVKSHTVFMTIAVEMMSIRGIINNTS